MGKGTASLIADAFLEGVELHKNNVSAIKAGGVSKILLFGQVIARGFPDGSIEITSAGSNSRTTMIYLNQLPGVSVEIDHKQNLILNGKKWNGSWTKIQ